MPANAVQFGLTINLHHTQAGVDERVLNSPAAACVAAGGGCEMSRAVWTLGPDGDYVRARRRRALDCHKKIVFCYLGSMLADFFSMSDAFEYECECVLVLASETASV